MSSFATIPVQASHQLAIVYRFRDTFHTPPGNSPPAIRNPLEVSIDLPSGKWTAIYSDRDGTYRFRMRLGEVPGGSWPVNVVSLDGKYQNFEPFNADLPVTWAGLHPVGGDYLVVKELWPTTLFHPPDGETAVYGLIQSTTLPVADLEVRLYKGATAPLKPYTRTNARGEFLFRLNKLPGTGGTDPNVKIEVMESGIVVPVTPSPFTVQLGKAQILSFTRT